MVIKPLLLTSGFGIESPLGGIERFVFSLCNGLVQKGLKPVVFGLWLYGNEYETRWMEELTKQGIEAKYGSIWKEDTPYKCYQESQLVFNKYISQSKVDVIHNHSQFGDLPAFWGKFIHGCPIIRSVHTEFEWKRRPLRRVLLTLLADPMLYNLEIGISPSITRKLNQRPIARLLKRKSIYIPNAINLGRFQDGLININECRNKLGIPGQAFVVGSVGRLTEQKGYLYLIRAAEAICNNHPFVYFCVIGGGDQEEMLKHEILSRGLSRRFLLPGPKAEIEKILPAFDVFASSSIWEGLPTVLLESMAVGIPIVATRIPGNTDLIRDGENGWLVNAGDPQALVDGIENAMNSDDLRQVFAQKNKVAVQSYSIDRIIETHYTIYNQLHLEN